MASPLVQVAQALCEALVFSVLHLTRLRVNAGELLQLATKSSETPSVVARRAAIAGVREVSLGEKTNKSLGKESNTW